MKRRNQVLDIARAEATSWVRSHLAPSDDPVVSRARWSPERAWDWYRSTPWLVGANFTPSTAGNQLEMFQADTFDPVTIDRELGYAAGIGMNSARIFLHDLLWDVDGEAFLDRLDRVLDIAAGHGIGVMPVLFDGIWDPRPHPGPQGEPKPGVHNSMWVQSPGAAVIGDRAQWGRLQGYVEAVMGRFASDPRIHVWDLFNEPDSPNPAYAFYEVAHKQRRIAELLEQIWDWADAVDPDQPITTGVFQHVARKLPEARPASRVMLERSDVITFHSYQPEPLLNRVIDRLEAYGRPLICTEWLGRPASPASLLEVFARRNVGAYNWGLVDGRTQTRLPWTSWFRPTPPGREWFHELFHPDGTPYDAAEAELFRRVTARTRGA